MPEPIFEPGPVATPFVYTVSGTGEVVPRTCQAEYNGSGAGGDYIPAVIFRSQAGHVVARAILQSTVTAGDDAEVSWFPGVKVAAAAATAGGAQWFFGSRFTALTVATNHPQRRIPWTHFVTSDSSVFSVTSGLATNDTVHGLKAGIYVAFGELVWASPQTYPRSCLIVTDFFGVSFAAQTPVNSSTTDTTAVGEPYLVGDGMLAITQAVPGEISLTAKNWDGVSHNVTQATYAIAYLPNSVLVT